MTVRTPLRVTAGVLLLALVGCSSSSARNAAPAATPVEVGVVVVSAEPIPLTTELPGRVQASRIAEVRARVAGIVLERAFQEGSEVAAGDLLYRIDPAPLQAAADSARAALARAQATLLQTQGRAGRYAKLVQTHAVSAQENDDAVAALASAEAEVSAARAALATARLNLGYATVTAPISGNIGRSEVTEGALVGQGEATLLATIQQVDPVYVNLTQSIGELQRLRAALRSGEMESIGEDQTTVTLLREDGTAHPQPGTLLFTDITVDEGTGSVSLRAEVPNPDRSLLPGEYVRAQLPQAIVAGGITVPQQAVRRTGTGANVIVVDAEQNAEIREVVVGQAVGDRWLVTEGLNDGEQVVVDGLQKVRPGAPLAPVAWE